MATWQVNQGDDKKEFVGYFWKGKFVDMLPKAQSDADQAKGMNKGYVLASVSVPNRDATVTVNVPGTGLVVLERYKDVFGSVAEVMMLFALILAELLRGCA